MNRNLILLLLIVVLKINAQSESILNWNENQKLKVLDFQAKPDVVSKGQAQTTYKIEIYPQNVMVDEKDRIKDYEKLTVFAQFYKKESWFKKVTDEIKLLSHEQLHFDIAELFARKIRQRFNELKAVKESRFNVYLSEYKKIWIACRRFQRLYDEETTHGFNRGANGLWKAKVDKMMKQLERFK